MVMAVAQTRGAPAKPRPVSKVLLSCNARLAFFSKLPAAEVGGCSFCLEPQFLDDRPPFLSISPLQGAECFGRLLLVGEKLIPEIGDSRAHRLVDQCVYDRRIEFANDVPGRA